jgi:hypothetical protein
MAVGPERRSSFLRRLPFVAVATFGAMAAIAAACVLPAATTVAGDGDGGTTADGASNDAQSGGSDGAIMPTADAADAAGVGDADAGAATDGSDASVSGWRYVGGTMKSDTTALLTVMVPVPVLKGDLLVAACGGTRSGSETLKPADDTWTSLNATKPIGGMFAQGFYLVAPTDNPAMSAAFEVSDSTAVTCVVNVYRGGTFTTVESTADQDTASEPSCGPVTAQPAALVFFYAGVSGNIPGNPTNTAFTRRMPFAAGDICGDTVIDAGADAGIDAGADAGIDAGPDAAPPSISTMVDQTEALWVCVMIAFDP